MQRNSQESQSAGPSSSCSGGAFIVHEMKDLKRPDGTRQQFLIGRISTDCLPDVLKLCKYFLRDEPMCSSINILNDPASVADFKKSWAAALESGWSIAAYVDPYNRKSSKKPIMAGVSLLEVTDRDVQAPEVNLPPKAKKIMDFIYSMMKDHKPMQEFGAQRSIIGNGMVVHPQYRGFGLGECLLRARECIAKACKIPLGLTVFTSAQAQNIALRVGYQEYAVGSYDEAVEEDGQPIFPSLKGQFVKHMYIKFDV